METEIISIQCLNKYTNYTIYTAKYISIVSIQCFGGQRVRTKEPQGRKWEEAVRELCIQANLYSPTGPGFLFDCICICFFVFSCICICLARVARYICNLYSRAFLDLYLTAFVFVIFFFCIGILLTSAVISPNLC